MNLIKLSISIIDEKNGLTNKILKTKTVMEIA